MMIFLKCLGKYIENLSLVFFGYLYWIIDLDLNKYYLRWMANRTTLKYTAYKFISILGDVSKWEI